MPVTNRKGRAREVVLPFLAAFATAALLGLAGGTAATAVATAEPARSVNALPNQSSITSTAQDANGAACKGNQGLRPTLTNNQINIRDTFVLVRLLKHPTHAARRRSRRPWTAATST